jgi:hypothetical protein
MISSDSPNVDMLLTTPLTAAMQGKDEFKQFLFSNLYFSMPKNLRELLGGTAAEDALKEWVASGMLPESHVPAIMKLIGLIALDDEVVLSDIPSILVKLGLTAEQADQITKNITLRRCRRFRPLVSRPLRVI